MTRRVLTGAACSAAAVAALAIGTAANADAATTAGISAAHHKAFDRVGALAGQHLASHHIDALVDPSLLKDAASDSGTCSTSGSPIYSWVGDYEAQQGWSDSDVDTVSQLAQFAEVYAIYYGNQTYGDEGQYTSVVTAELGHLQDFWVIDRPNTNARGWHGDVVFDYDDMVQVAEVLGDSSSQAQSDAEAIVEAANEVPGLTGDDPLLTFNSVSDSETGTIAMGDGITEVYTQNGFDGTDVEQFIMGHEFGHQVQFATDYNPDPSYGLETGADAASAYFVAHAQGLQFDADQIDEAARAAYDIGDCQHSHGTPEQRQASTEWGADQGASDPGQVLTGQEFIDAWDAEFQNEIVPLDTV